VEGNAGQVGTQVVAILAVSAFSAVATFVILKVVDALVGLRVEESEEELGLDASQHGEVAWQS
jgi:Amt family ammonium transporter